VNLRLMMSRASSMPWIARRLFSSQVATCFVDMKPGFQSFQSWPRGLRRMGTPALARSHYGASLGPLAGTVISYAPNFQERGNARPPHMGMNASRCTPMTHL